MVPGRAELQGIDGSSLQDSWGLPHLRISKFVLHHDREPWKKQWLIHFLHGQLV